MAEKPKSRESQDPRATSPVAGDVDREEDVTSELSLPWASDEDFGSAPLVDMETDNTLETGTLLNDRFEIVELVHSGGMGHVYKAVDRRRHPAGSGRIHVAIKMLRESLAERDEFRLVLEREAAKAQSLSHSNIINIFDFDEHEGRFFLVMEWLEGESVRALLNRTGGQRLAPTFAWTVIEGVAEALHHAHRNNVIHADVNPSNIFITETLDIKLLDFGVARCADDALDPADKGVTWATQTYASPEVLSGLSPVFQDDVFSLGCVAYRLLGGEHPFGGSSSITARDGGIAVEPIPGVPESEWQILRRALAYSRAERPDTVEVFLRKHHSSAIGVRSHEAKWSAAFLQRPLLVAMGVVAAVALAWWFGPVAPVTETLPEDDPSGAPVEAVAQSEATVVDDLLVAARLAAEDQRLVLPEEDNARSQYREILIVEPGNGEALRGLRSISDVFVERAVAALKSGDPQAAASSLTTASETDASNPAITMVSELLVAQGDAELSAAQAAAATGNMGQATSALARAEQYEHIDPSAINSVRERLAEAARESELLDGLDTVERHLAADRLLAPAAGNARASLAALRNAYGGDPRLTAAYERLAERLLTRAAFATAAGRLDDAENLIDAADSLGVLEAEVQLARESLVRTAAITDPVPEAVIADEAPEEPDPTTIESEAPADTGNELDAAALPSQELVAQASAAGPARSEPDTGSAGGPITTDAPGRSTATSLEELGLERFIAPAYPRRAQRRGLNGYVDVAFDINPDGRTDAIEILGGENTDIFGESASDAVRKWRFAPRPDTVRENVILRFEIAD